uniref:Uncharacterized protein n=1 Tax=Setaria viridis TaxID=4556 RepID=A0A4V6D8X3_SETVI|nr:hypothetical protein SEVIR_3G005200v2 [Setaria viridis]
MGCSLDWALVSYFDFCCLICVSMAVAPTALPHCVYRLGDKKSASHCKLHYHLKNIGLNMKEWGLNLSII